MKKILALILGLSLSFLAFADEFSGLNEILIMARQGNQVAQNNLGSLYNDGKGVPQDYKKAFYWYEKSANHNFAPAQFVVGSAYEMGKGVIKNRELMQQWYDKFCKNGLCKL